MCVKERKEGRKNEYARKKEKKRERERKNVYARKKEERKKERKDEKR